MQGKTNSTQIPHIPAQNFFILSSGCQQASSVVRKLKLSESAFLAQENTDLFTITLRVEGQLSTVRAGCDDVQIDRIDGQTRNKSCLSVLFVFGCEQNRKETIKLVERRSQKIQQIQNCSSGLTTRGNLINLIGSFDVEHFDGFVVAGKHFCTLRVNCN